MTMRAAILHGQEDVRIERVPVPDVEPGGLLIRVRAALTCGTDVKVFKRGYHAKMITPPALFGHEFAGEVEIGNDRFKKGQRVVAANSAACGECYYCCKLQPNLCEDLLFNNGAYAEFIHVPERIAEKNTYAIPARASFEDAALLEPLACAIKGVHDSGISANDIVAVVGLGPLGMMLVKAAKRRGARVIAIGRRSEQTMRAMSMGADCGIFERPLDQIGAFTYGRGADVVIEAVGTPDTWQLAVKLVRQGGTVNFFGGPPSGTTVTFDTNRMHYSELTFKASFHHTPEHVQRALDWIGEGYVSAQQFVQRSAMLEELPDILRGLAARNSHLKTAIIP